MDRNSFIGFALLVALLVGYIVYNNQSQKKFQAQKQQKVQQDSIRFARTHPASAAPAAPVPSAAQDSALNALPAAYHGTARTVRLENKKVIIEFSTKGGYPVSAQLKGFKTYTQKPLMLFAGPSNRLSADIGGDARARSTADLYFEPEIHTAPDGNQIASFTADAGNGKKAEFQYILPADDYMMHCNLRLNGMQSQRLTWQLNALSTERDIATERTNSQMYWRLQDRDHDYFTMRDEKQEQLGKPVAWVGYRLHYFSTALVADNAFPSADIRTSTRTAKDTVSQTVVTLPIGAVEGTQQSVNMRWYIGPNHYQTLKSYGQDLEDMVPLGTGLFAFVKYINKWVIIPIFNLLSSFIGNYGLIIILLTVFIRLLLSFFTYKSYLSAAKMRVLKPELDELRAKYPGDQQKFGMEQMKLYRSAGVNPLGGCLPTLLQLPILFAMYSFFPSSIELRQKSFLWAHDLSTYDSIATIPNIPFFGDHISLFTLLMTASSLFLALYNRNLTPQDPNNPMMKYMPFVFPIILMGVFNKMAAALTFYYFFSNMISILQQFVIQKFIIDEKKIHAQMIENRNKPAAPSKWQQRMEEMQKAQLERARQRPSK